MIDPGPDFSAKGQDHEHDQDQEQEVAAGAVVIFRPPHYNRGSLRP
jgi:hypothetical protein